ncbi:hypothetical protein [Desulforhopalus sp. IMCC35007]|uniref:hypothetical protein n=1 Tax=Desulforhopalus sp. IMCC35007 TaxID=2569543 RepID=UPI0010AE4F4D|nr:hypothetical protein [Desulforhopalus sp. IMCC35007]TKB09875.1 hypothetical protein FCL48_07860 [Desulforhopalus sp. IMCC35007]
MGTDVEVAIVRACCKSCDNEELYWMMSRSQVEFVAKNLELVHSSGDQIFARYGDQVLPLVSLESHFGFVADNIQKREKFIGVRFVNNDGKLQRLVITTGDSPHFFALNLSFSTMDSFSAPQNNTHIQGVYLLGKGKVAVVPDITNVSSGTL